MNLDGLPQELVEGDRQLVDRCLAGESEAWGELFSRFHSTLCLLVKSSLRYSPGDAELVEEIVARVWYKVISSEGRLLDAYRVENRCRLSTYLLRLARAEAKEYFRSESRRSRRERLASGQAIALPTSDEGPLNDEIFESLTPAEQRFLARVLLSPHDKGENVGDKAGNGAYSATNTWQLRNRIAKKIRLHYHPA